MRVVFLGLSITSSWGNGHATTYRGLVRELCARGHEVLFLERDLPWYAAARDLPQPPCGETRLYGSLKELKDRSLPDLRTADLVVLGSYVPEGAQVGELVTRAARGVTAFYDIDTPVTLAAVKKGECGYLTRELIPRFDLYLSFTGGPTLARLRREFGAASPRALYCSFDPGLYFPEPRARKRWDLGYLGTYSACRQEPLERLMLKAALAWPEGRMVVAGPQYPGTVAWPPNVERIEHLAPPEHRRFYNAQVFTLNVTRADMVEAGYSPSVRLFEAAACGTPIISDPWEGLDSILRVGTEVLVSRSAAETLELVRDLSERERRSVAERARARVLAEHTAAHRATELERYAAEAAEGRAAGRPARRRRQLTGAAG